MPHTHLSQSKSHRDLATSLRGSRTRRHARLRHRHLCCEPLEERQLLSVVTSFTNNTPQAIKDRGTITSAITVPAGYLISTVTLDITHTRDEDLDVFLIGPDRTRVELFTDVGGTGDNFTSTTLDDRTDLKIAKVFRPVHRDLPPGGLPRHVPRQADARDLETRSHRRHARRDWPLELLVADDGRGVGGVD